MVTNQYRKIINGKVCIKTLAFGLLEVKKQYDLKNGLQNVSAYRKDLTKKNISQRFVCYVLYDFNPMDGTVGFHEVYRGKNCIRDSIRCLDRYHKILANYK